MGDTKINEIQGIYSQIDGTECNQSVSMLCSKYYNGAMHRNDVKTLTEHAHLTLEGHSEILPAEKRITRQRNLRIVSCLISEKLELGVLKAGDSCNGRNWQND